MSGEVLKDGAHPTDGSISDVGKDLLHAIEELLADPTMRHPIVKGVVMPSKVEKLGEAVRGGQREKTAEDLLPLEELDRNPSGREQVDDSSLRGIVAGIIFSGHHRPKILPPEDRGGLKG